MENYNNEIFGFDSNTNENTEQSVNFNYDSINGLGQSDYENEDLFNTEVENTNSSMFDNFYGQENDNQEEINNVGTNFVESNDLVTPLETEDFNIEYKVEDQPKENDSIPPVEEVDSFEEFMIETPMITAETEETKVEAEKTVQENN